MKEWSRAVKLTKANAPGIAAQLLAGKTYGEIAKELSSNNEDRKEPVVNSFVYRQGGLILGRLSEQDIGLLLPRRKGAWSLNVAAFLFYYGKVEHGVAIDMATTINHRSAHASEGK